MSHISLGLRADKGLGFLGAAVLPDHRRGGSDHTGNVGQVRRNDDRVVRPGQVAEFGDVLLGDPKVYRLGAAGLANGLGDVTNALGCGLGDFADLFGTPLGFIDPPGTTP